MKYLLPRMGLLLVLGFPLGASSAQGAPQPAENVPSPTPQVSASPQAAPATQSQAAPATQSQAAPQPQLQTASASAHPTQSDLLNVRDPFKRPDIAIERAAIKSELEQYPLEELKMIGVLTGPDRMRALLKSNDGKTHFVAVGMKIGQKNGVVRKITSELIQVRERVVNVLDQEENVDSIIQLQAESLDGATGARPRTSAFRVGNENQDSHSAPEREDRNQGRANGAGNPGAGAPAGLPAGMNPSGTNPDARPGMPKVDE